MSAQSFDHPEVLVGGMVVEDGVDGLAGRDLPLDGCRQHAPRTPDVLLRAVAVINDFLQALAISRAQMDGDAGAHFAHSHGLRAKGIPPGTLMTASIH